MRGRTGWSMLAVACLVLAACGDDDDGGTDAGGGGDTTAQAASPTSAVAGDDDSTEASGPAEAATAADDSLSPVLVGFHNLEGGAIDLTGIRTGFETGMRYVNEELGGINGHPVEIESCNLDITPESSVNCANTFVERNVVAAIQGVDVAGDAALPILVQAGIAEIGFFAFSPAMNDSQGDVFMTLFSNEEVYAASLIAQQELGAEKVAVLIADLPSGHAVAEEVVEPVAEQLGLDIETFFYPTQTDWTSFAATVLATNPDGVSFTAAEEPVCLGAIPALKGAGFEGPLHVSTCNIYIEELDVEMIEGIVNHDNYYSSLMGDAVPEKAAQDLAIYERFMERDAPADINSSYALLGFHIAVIAADMLRQVETDGELTAEVVKAALPNVEGDRFFRDADEGYDCANPTWPDTTACGGGVLFSSVTAERTKQILDFSPVDVGAVRPAG